MAFYSIAFILSRLFLPFEVVSGQANWLATGKKASRYRSFRFLKLQLPRRGTNEEVAKLHKLNLTDRGLNSVPNQ
jgi:hypothetical protein